MKQDSKPSMHTALLNFSRALERYARSTHELRHAAERMHGHVRLISGHAGSIAQNAHTPHPPHSTRQTPAKGTSPGHR